MMQAVISRPPAPSEGTNPGTGPVGRHGRATV
jgi:hypothetical protein